MAVKSEPFGQAGRGHNIIDCEAHPFNPRYLVVKASGGTVTMTGRMVNSEGRPLPQQSGAPMGLSTFVLTITVAAGAVTWLALMAAAGFAVPSACEAIVFEITGGDLYWNLGGLASGLLDPGHTDIAPVSGLDGKWALGSTNLVMGALNRAALATLGGASSGGGGGGGGASGPTTAPWVDRSGTITAGGVAQVIVPANANRKRLFIMNPRLAAESFWINLDAAATGASPSIELVPGAVWDESGLTLSGQAVSGYAVTIAHAWTAKEA